MSLAIWLVLAACAVAVVTDIRARRIPNILTAALAVGALTLHAFEGWHAFLIAVAIMVGVTLLGFIAFSLGWLGGGDVKLLAAGAAALGSSDVFGFLLYTAIGGGLLAVGFALITGRFSAVMSSVSKIIRPLVYKGTVAEAPSKPIMLPYAIAIAFGAGAVALSHTAAPFLRLPL
jgi:prepilin peptidase CpaA